MVVIVTGYTLFATSYLRLQTNVQVCWRNLHIIKHALVVVVQRVTGMNINYSISALQVKRPEKITEINATTEQFMQ